MPRLILHVGIHKTGSSAIQSALARNAGALRARNMTYPDFASLPAARLGRISSGNGLPLAKLLGSPTPYAQPVSRAAIDAEVERAYAQGRDLLYSSEALLFINPDKASAFLASVRNIGFDARLAIYVRSVADLALSMYHQDVKQKRLTGSFGEFLRSFEAGPLRSALSLCRVFGRENATMRNYDACKDNLIEDFFQNMLGFQTLDGFSLENPAVNRSLTGAELAIMREMNAVLTNPRHSRLATEALIDANRAATYDRTIGREDYRAIEAKFSPLVAAVNGCGPHVPIALKSGDLDIGDAAEFELSEAEASLARLSASVIEMVGAIRWPKRRQ